jgi:hypothetical protein
MVDVLRAGAKAGEAVLAGMAGGAIFSTAQEPLTPQRIAIISFFIVIAMAGYILIRAYYEWRRGERLD